MSVKYLGDLPTGSFVSDPSYPLRFIRYSGSAAWDTSYSERIETIYEPLRWRVICQERLGGTVTTLIADSPVMYLSNAINTTEADTYNFKNSRVYNFLNTNDAHFYPALSNEFKSAIVPVSITTGDVKTTDVKFFILSKVEYGGDPEYGLENEDNGTPIPYFDSDAKRRPIDNMSMMYINNDNSISKILLRGATNGISNKRRVHYMNPNGTFDATNVSNGSIIPVVNLRSDTPVSDFKLFDAHLLFDNDSKSFFQSVYVKIEGQWKQAVYRGFKKDGIWL